MQYSIIGDIIVVRPGEKVPLDGVVVSGHSTLDTAALTGESLPRDVSCGSDILSGCINLSGLIEVRCEKEFGRSTVSKILELVENATSQKAKTENFITRFAAVYTPAVVGAAVVLAVVPPLVIEGALFSDWLYRALSFLVVSCPCALVISVPLGFFGGIGAASGIGVLVKGSNYLEAAAHAEFVVMDKTGTLTKGVFEVEKVRAAEDFEGGEERLLKLAAAACCSLSETGFRKLFDNIDFFKDKIILRPEEISNHPEVLRRLGVISINTAIEMDIYGNVNSSHIMGKKMMNGIGGSGDFSRNAGISIFTTSSTAKGGAISSIVPMCSHVDHTEHEVMVVVTEQGHADLRGLSPKERAVKIIENCVHPDYRDKLMDYFNRACNEMPCQTPHILDEALSWHSKYEKTGSMK